MKRDLSFSDSKIAQFVECQQSYSFENINHINSESSEKDSITQSSSLTRSLSRTSNDILKLGKDALLIEPNKRDESHIDSIFLYMMEFNLFPNVDHNIKLNICHAAKLVICAPETILIKTGDPFECQYIVVSGEVIFTSQNCIKTSFGECRSFGLLFDAQDVENFNSMGIYQISDEICELIVISLDDFLKCGEDFSCVLGTEEEEDTVEAHYDNNFLVTVNQDKIMDILFDEKYLEIEPNFVVDFFLTYSIFFTGSKELIYKIQNCLINDIIRQKAAALLIIWITYCPEDFLDDYMQDFIVFIVRELKSKSCNFLAEVISHVCYTRSLAYEIRFTIRLDEDIPLRFKYRIVQSCSNKEQIELFVVHLDPDSKASSSGIQLFDQIIVFNDFQVSEMSIYQLENVITTSIVFYLIVKRCIIKYTFIENLLMDLFQTKAKSTANIYHEEKLNKSNRSSVMDFSLKKISRFKTLTLKKKAERKAVTSSIQFDAKDSGLPNESCNSLNQANIDCNALSKARSNPHSTEESSLSKHQDTPTNAHFIVKVYNSANEAKYLNLARSDTCKKISNDLFFHASLLKKSNTTHFDKSATVASSQFNSYIFLAKITPAGIKVSRLSDELFDLSSRWVPGSVFYVVPTSSEIKITKEMETEMRAEASMSIIELDAAIISKLITIYDFYKFTKISSKEYIADILKCKIDVNCENLKYFERRCNFEVMWVVSEILVEPIIKRRVKIISKFIKIAQYCLDLGNFNTFFSLIGGLEYNLIARLKTTWEFVPQKLMKLFNTLKLYCDPMNNMSRYREWLIKYSLTKNRACDSLVIPLLPLLKKDLTFIHDSSKTFSSNDQINYKKIRMLAKELRKFSYFRESKFTLANAFQLKTNTPSYLLNSPSLLFAPYDPIDNSIILSNISPNILNFFQVDRQKLFDNRASSFIYQNYDKRLYDEFSMARKVQIYLEKIDHQNTDYEALKMKSYGYDIPPKFVMDSFMKSIAHAASSTSPSLSLASADSSIPHPDSEKCLNDVYPNDNDDDLGTLV